MDGPFYIDSRGPYNYADFPSVTLTGTLQAIIPAGSYPVLGANYFSWVGKAIRIRVMGRMTTGTTPGNITMQLNWGAGTSNTGTNIQGVALVGTASQTNTTWQLEMYVRCRSCGTSGSLLGSGWWHVQGTGLVAIPPSVPAASSGLDLTQNWIPHLQSLRSGSTVETIQVHDLSFEALN